MVNPSVTRFYRLEASGRTGRSTPRQVLYRRSFGTIPGLEGFVHGLSALRVPPPGAGRARLAPLPRLGRGARRRLGVRAVAARALRQERAAAQAGHRGGAGREVLRGSGARPARAGHHVDADPAADAQHHGAVRVAGPARLHRGVLRRPGAAVHDPGVQRPAAGLAVASVRAARLAARGRDVGGGGPDPPLPDQGAGRAAADLPAVLRALHPDGPGRQPDRPDRQAQVRHGPRRPARRDAGLPAPHARRPRRRGLRRGRG